MRRGQRALIPILAAQLLAATFPASGLARAVERPQAVERGDAAAERGDAAAELRVVLMTFGPGAAVWERFGHNALWIHDPQRGTDVAYHYGLFDMSESGFLLHFLQGRMSYSMGEAPALLLLEHYLGVGRDATLQELRLTPVQARELQAFLTWNMRPENRVYRYDYFRDNCSTRIRDALDRVLDGSLSDSLGARPTSITYRSEALGLTAEDRLLTAGMDLGLGPLADQALTRWDLAFIPMRLRDDVRSLTVDIDGRQVALVASEQRFPPLGDADPDLAAPPGAVSARVAWMLLLGSLLGAAFAALGWIAGRGARGPRAALAAGGALWGLIAGVLGFILLGLWTLTDHEFAHRNENLLQVNPLALALVVLLPMALARQWSRHALAVAALLAATSILGLLIHPLPITPQDNLGSIALALPINLGLLFGLWRCRAAPTVSQPG